MICSSILGYLILVKLNFICVLAVYVLSRNIHKNIQILKCIQNLHTYSSYLGDYDITKIIDIYLILI